MSPGRQHIPVLAKVRRSGGDGFSVVHAAHAASARHPWLAASFDFTPFPLCLDRPEFACLADSLVLVN